MSRAALAKRAGVSEPTVNRILSGREASPKLSNVAAIAEALGLELCLHPVMDEETLREHQAEEKARAMAKMVQGTMGLEAQALDQSGYERLVSRTKHKLLAGSDRRLWEE